MVYPHVRLITDEVDVHFDRYVWSRNEPFEYWLLIEARQEWDGTMSFYSYNDSDRRFGYAKLRVRAKAEECNGRVLEEPDAKARMSDPEWSLAPGVDAER
jgi:hypothetical protein